MANVEWVKIKNEYITSNISQRKLAEKYGVSSRQIAMHCKHEKWVELRKETQDQISAKLQQETADKIIETEVDRIANVIELSDLLAEKVKIAINQLEMEVVNEKVLEIGIVDTYKLRRLVQCTKDLKDIVRDNSDSSDIKKLDAVLDKIEGKI